MIKTEKEMEKLKTEAFKAITCLCPEVHESITENVIKKVSAFTNALEANLAAAEKISERLCSSLTSKSFSSIVEEIRKDNQ